jgi:tyrosine-protein kinase Etk/Wzc
VTNEVETESQHFPETLNGGRVQRDDVEDGEISVTELLTRLTAKKWLIAGSAVAGGLIAAAIAFSIPNMYTATAIVMPPQQPQTAVSSLVGQLGPLAAVAGHDFGLKTPGDLYVGLLGSRTIADRLIERFHLSSLYDTKTMVDTRGKLKAYTRFSSGKDSLIHVEVDDHDPKRAADLANAYVAELNAQNTLLATSEATQRRLFLENALRDEKTALVSAEEMMKQTQTRTGVIQVEGQTSVAIAAVAQVKAQITAGEVAMQRLKMGATNENPEVLRLEAELNALRVQLRNLQQSPRSASDPIVPTSAIPQAGLDYLRGLRELKYHEFLFEMLSKQYEAARIDESKVAPALQIVDIAVPPDKKSGPHRGLMIVFGIVTAFTLSCVAAHLGQGRHG